MQRLQLAYPLSCGMSLLGTKQLLKPQFQVSASGRILPIAVFWAKMPSFDTVAQNARLRIRKRAFAKCIS